MKWWLVQMLLLAPDEAGGGAPAAPDAGSDAGDAGGGEDTGADAGVEDGASAPGADAGDDDDADDDVETQFSEASYRDDPNFKRVIAKLKKQNRQLARMRPVMSRIKDVNLDDVMNRAASADQLRQVLAAHPDLAEEVLKAVSGTRKRAGGEGSQAKFDRNNLPFSVEDDSGKFFADFYERFLAMEEELKTTKQELSGVRESGQRDKAVQERLQWKSAVKAAAAKVPEWARDMFNDAVYGAYAEASRRGTQLDSQRVINHYLSKLPIGNKAQAAARAAAAQRIAGTNSNLPRVPNGSGVPAGARKKGETVADVNRRLRSGGFFAR